MLSAVRRFASKRIKPLTTSRGWRVLRRLDVRQDRRRKRQAIETAIAAEVERRIELDRRERAERTLQRAAASAGLSKPLCHLLGELDRLLSDASDPKVAVLGGPEASGVARVIAKLLNSVRITVVADALSDSARHVRLAASGPFQAIIVFGPTGQAATLLSNLLFHARQGGLLAVVIGPEDELSQHEVLALLTRLRLARDRGRGRAASAPRLDLDERALARAVGRVVVTDQYVIIQNRTAALAKLRDEEMATFLTLVDPPFGEVLDHVSPETRQDLSVVRDHDGDVVQRTRGEIGSPALELRAYRDVLCVPRQVVTTNNVILPETYRHLARERLLNKRLIEVAPRFAKIKTDISQQRHLEGTYFHWDSEFPGHYGHTLTEQVSRLWGLQRARDLYPDVKLLVGLRQRQRLPMPFELTILEAVGVLADDIETYDDPTRVERLVAATPMFSMPQYVSPQIAATWDQVGDAIVRETSRSEFPARIFCGRSDHPKRHCRNAAVVESLFQSHGFEIVQPELMPLADQIALFRGAEVVAGYAGSALFTLMFCADPKPVIMVAPQSYTATNEYLIGAVRGHEFDVFWSRSESSAFTSSFSVDFEREGRQISDHLRHLGEG